jgi:energy-converting hydrogenase Eha subunit H
MRDEILISLNVDNNTFKIKVHIPMVVSVVCVVGVVVVPDVVDTVVSLTVVPLVVLGTVQTQNTPL